MSQVLDDLGVAPRVCCLQDPGLTFGLEFTLEAVVGRLCRLVTTPGIRKTKLWWTLFIHNCEHLRRPVWNMGGSLFIMG